MKLQSTKCFTLYTTRPALQTLRECQKLLLVLFTATSALASLRSLAGLCGMHGDLCSDV